MDLFIRDDRILFGSYRVRLLMLNWLLEFEANWKLINYIWLYTFLDVISVIVRSRSKAMQCWRWDLGQWRIDIIWSSSWSS
jgi:hypothetical protein